MAETAPNNHYDCCPDCNTEPCICEDDGWYHDGWCLRCEENLEDCTCDVCPECGDDWEICDCGR